METKKRYYAFLIALPALLIVFLLRIPALIISLILPFKQYDYFKGLLGSPWAGTDNFEFIFSGRALWPIIKNTLILNSGFFLIALLLSIVIGYSLANVRISWLYKAFSILFIIPFFIPQTYWNVLLIKLFNVDGLVNASASDPKLYLAYPGAVRAMYIGIEIIKWAGLFAALIAFAVRNVPLNERIRATFKAALSITLVSLAFILITDFELLHQLANPYNYETLDTFTLYTFRAGLDFAEPSLAAGPWLFQFLLSLIVLITLFFTGERFIKKSLVPKLDTYTSEQTTAGKMTSPLAIIIPALYSLLLLFSFILLIIAATDIGKFVQTDLFIKSWFIYILIAIFTSLIGLMLTILLAYPLTTSTPLIRKLYMVFFLILIAALQFGLHDYLFIKSLQALYSYAAIIISSLFNPIWVILLATYYSYKSGDTPEGFVKYLQKSLPAIICIFIGSFLLNIDSYTYSMLYIDNPEMYSPTFQIHRGFTSPH